jgi:hypothetical protein
MEKVVIQFDADFSQLEQSINKLKSGGMQELSSATNGVQSSMEKLSTSAKNIPLNVVTQGVQQATESLKQNSQAITENVGKQQSMKAELKELKNQLQQLEDQGKDNTKEFEQMAIRAGQLSDQIGDTSNRIKALADDSKYIKAVSQAIGAMASAYSVAQGASALFGQENKDIEKALLKVNAAMSIANGLQQINETLQKQSTLAVIAHNTAQKLYNFFIVEGTAATSAFRIALAGTGIGLAVVALTFLYQAYQEHNKKVKQASVETMAFGDALKSSLGQASSEISNLQVLYKAATDASRSLESRKEAVKELQQMYPSYFGNLSQEAILNGKAKTSYDELNSAILDNARARAYTNMLEDRITKQEQDLQTRRQYIDITKQNIENLKNTRAEMEKAGVSTAAIDNQIKTATDGLIKQQKALNDQVTANANANEDLTKQILLYTDKTSKYQQDKSGETTQKVIDDNKLRLQNEIEYYQIKVNKADEALANTDKGTKAELEAQVALQYAQTQLSIKQVEQSTDSEALKKSKIELLNAQMYAKIKEMMASYDKAQEDSANKQVKTTVKATEKQVDEIDQIWAQWRQEDEDAIKTHNEKKAKEEGDIRKRNIETLKSESIRVSQDIINSQFEIDKANRDAKLQADIDALEKRKEHELKNKNLTEAQKQAIDNKYAKLEAEEKTKAWKADQKAKEEQAIINGALAVTSILASATDPVTKGILIAASAITTAAQVRVIASQPVPKFAKGKNVDDLYEGQALIGEAGRELRFDRDGTVKLYNKPTFDYVKKDTIIAPNALTEALLGANLPALNLNTLSAMSKNATITGTFNLDYDKLATTISNQMNQHQKVSINIDEKGFQTRIIEGANQRQIIDNHFKM